MKNVSVFIIVYAVIILSCSKKDDAKTNYSEVDIPINKIELLNGVNNIDTIDNKLLIFNPYKNKGKLALKGSMHNHTDNSISIDGYASGDPVATAIKFRDIGGFDFYTYTDHNFVTRDPQASGIVWMGKSVEDTQFGHHLCIYNLPANYEFINAGDDINSQISYYHGIGAFVSYAHPDWHDQIQSDSKILSTNDIDFVEIINSDISERAFNLLLSKNIVFGFGVDDYHYNSTWKDPDMLFNKGYIIAFADFKEKKSIWKAILTGCFYASNGARMDISCKNGEITVIAEKTSKIDFIGKNEQNLSVCKILKSVDATLSASYVITGDESYVWVCLANSDGMAYSQAFIMNNE
jgi:hypothetical protein